VSIALHDIAAAVGAVTGLDLDHGGDPLVTGISHDSRAVAPGWLFCCVPGATADGHRFAADAVSAGAVALLVERPLPVDAPQLVVPDVRAAMGPAAAAVHGHPSRAMTVIGVTGTNGKSSVVQLLADIWTRAGLRAEIFGTLTGPRTTPEATDLQRQLRESRQRGTELVAMEVSSHALELSRVAGTSFAAAVFTNLGHDHLDFHPDMEAYYRAKARLFDPALTPIAVVNGDDPYGRRLIGELAEPVAAGCLQTIGYRLSDAKHLVIDGPSSRFEWRGQPVALHLAGSHNASNALAAAATAAALGLDLAVIADGLSSTRPVRGRFEIIDAGRPFRVAVDYAHTPDALQAALRAAREIAAGQVIVVFGCGGERDHDKRPEMGLVAQREADLVFVTSDNPRSEDPDRIIDDIVARLERGHPTKVLVEPDRRKAIAAALGSAQDGDLVLIAGKGHETEQVIGDRRLPFDDRAVALDELGAVA
jgi:UDP-N-acetylmuramoyl-L-alanyl-D-glutamate--2,6-diaminopimelate ligase